MEEEIEYVQVEHDARQDVVVVPEPLRDLPRVEYDKPREEEGAKEAVQAARQRREEQREQTPENEEEQTRRQPSFHEGPVSF